MVFTPLLPATPTTCCLEAACHRAQAPALKQVQNSVKIHQTLIDSVEDVTLQNLTNKTVDQNTLHNKFQTRQVGTNAL